MEILEKIMQIKNKALNSSDLKELISKKKETMVKEVFSNYTKDEKIELAKEYNILDENENGLKYILWSITIPTIMCPIGVVTDNTWLMFTPILLFPLVILYTMSLPFRNNNTNKWFSDSSNINLLYMRMCADSAVDKDVLKLFVKIYGNEELVHLLTDKDYLTYTNIQLYINSHEQKKSMENKKNKIREAVNCLSE